ncbi:hypothetical protein AVEN_265204-1 [Araneus ventricosus]|uniref:Uncharacterized protein n=1 Tax=Araneus ventricosus TaxID=182803 RepID=A0A4Y2CR55_ARAVE|nr:hypothetical protein AVEN_265204-1 [Araneus ventricosus]
MCACALLENELHTFFEEKFYITTTNIDFSDDLSNGAHGKLKHVEFNEETTFAEYGWNFLVLLRLLARWIGLNYHEMPLILAGDFYYSNPAVSATKFHTTIDAVFSGCINKIETYTFVSYFSYHKTIVSMIECDD